MNCPRCLANCPSEDNFCGKCGSSLRSPGSVVSLSPKKLGVLLCLVVVLVLGILYIEPFFLGKAPTMKHTFGEGKGEEPYETATIQGLKAEVAIEPENLERRQELVRMLWSRLADFETPPTGLILDLIDQLGAVLLKAPKDTQALLMMANLTFNQKVFSKSTEYYERYLVLRPDDSEARASFASSLTFMGDFERALKELDTVLSQTPDSFQANAYKAITLAQMGRTDAARELGAKVLALAPTEEAKVRFEGFISSLSPAQSVSTLPTPNSNTPTTSPERSVVKFVRDHSIAGPKFVSASFDNGVLSLLFRQFPIESMPPAVRQSFIGKLLAEAKKDSDISGLALIDADTNKAMFSEKW